MGPHDGINDFTERGPELASGVSPWDALGHIVLQQEGPHQIPDQHSETSQPLEQSAK